MLVSYKEKCLLPEGTFGSVLVFRQSKDVMSESTNTFYVPMYKSQLFARTGELIAGIPPDANRSVETIANELEQLFLTDLPETLILPSRGTKLTCTGCGRTSNEVPQFYLKHSHGLYALLCYDSGNGCWERSSRTNCTYVEHPHGTQCEELAEFAVVYGEDGLAERYVCRDHVARVLSDVPVHRIFPIED